MPTDNVRAGASESGSSGSCAAAGMHSRAASSKRPVVVAFMLTLITDRLARGQPLSWSRFGQLSQIASQSAGAGRIPLHPLARRDAVPDLREHTVLLPDLDVAQHRPAVFPGKQRPVLAIPKQGCQRDGEHAVSLPQHNAGLNLVAVAEPLPAVLAREIDDHVDALLLDAERGNLQEAERLDETHVSFERFLAAPVVDDDALAGFDFHRVHRQVIGHDLEIFRVADLHQDIAFAHDPLAPVRDLQDAATDRGRDGDAIAGFL